MDESFRFALDWDLLVRFIDGRATFARLPRFLAAFRVHEAQKASADFSEIGMAEIRRLRERIHGRAVNTTELRRAIWSYMIRSGILNRLYRMGLIGY